MAPIVAPNTARFSVNGTYLDQPVATILDLQLVVVSGTGPSRADWLLAMAGQIGVSLSNIVDLLSAQLQYTGVTWVDLNTADGLVGSFDFLSPIAGNDLTPPMPGNVAFRANKTSTSFERGQRAGRMYFPGVPESFTAGNDGNNIQSATLTSLQSGLSAFLEELTEEIDGDDVGVFRGSLVVVHTARPAPDEDPVYTGYSTVNALVGQARLASQRRRLTL